MLHDSTAHRVASMKRVAENGDVQIILNGLLVTVPASTMSQKDRKLMTSLSRADINKPA
jgi:hypothetical protein